MQDVATPTDTLTQNAKSAAIGRAEKIKSAAAEKIREGKAKAQELHTSAEAYVREHPTKCVVGALGVGLLIGLMVRR